MSNITGDAAGSFSSGNSGSDEQLRQDHFHGSNSGPSTTNSNGSISPQQQQQHQPPVKKKRNLPGTPDPNAEVIALSPKSLMATNRFLCEICNKGFQRDQNLQLHRRGHNLPWKLKQRIGNEIKKRVYICPEPTCIHHNRARALGDLTGIKKHFCRKHGEKKWKCEKCSKKYAVQSDWKAHSKTCGTKEYKCDCGTIFSRRDSFITHRAFCDALTEENNKIGNGLTSNFPGNLQGKVSKLMSTMPLVNDTSIGVPEFNLQEVKNPLIMKSLPRDLMSMQIKSPSMIGDMFSSSSSTLFGGLRNMPSSFDSFHGSKMDGQLLGSSAHMSATALLQKAAQMGATASNTINSPMAGPDQFSSMITTSYGEEMLEQHHIQPQTDQQSELARMDGGGFTNHFWGDDMMTVDFLGIGGSRSTNLREQHQGLLPFQQQISHGQEAMEKSMWDI
ncbi:hypothetical protein NE237_013926 [Protea cynaroides]|uniref:C2H2-type domain-containing protein n=1 Tax=Protea cynaroides TaxID=273540 RepID=A0A9Q0H2M2_9MAGN|nr:hypothetical protein NE237_013926 [Protea cynaroides]